MSKDTDNYAKRAGITPGPWCTKGQNSSIYHQSVREFFAVFGVRTAPQPNMMGNTIMDGVAENCTLNDARAIAEVPAMIEALREMLESGVSYNGISRARAILKRIEG